MKSLPARVGHRRAIKRAEAHISITRNAEEPAVRGVGCFPISRHVVVLRLAQEPARRLQPALSVIAQQIIKPKNKD